MIEKNPYLSGNFAPVYDELDVSELQIKGKIPEELNGIYIAMGPTQHLILLVILILLINHMQLCCMILY